MSLILDLVPPPTARVILRTAAGIGAGVTRAPAVPVRRLPFPFRFHTRRPSMSKAPVRVAVTGAAGQIGYALLFRIASGEMLGKDSR